MKYNMQLVVVVVVVAVEGGDRGWDGCRVVGGCGSEGGGRGWDGGGGCGSGGW